MVEKLEQLVSRNEGLKNALDGMKQAKNRLENELSRSEQKNRTLEAEIRQLKQDNRELEDLKTFADELDMIITKEEADILAECLEGLRESRKPSKGQLEPDRSKGRSMTAGIFKRNVLTVAAVELEEKLDVDIFLYTVKNGRKVVGYEMQITVNKQEDSSLEQHESDKF